IADSPEEILRWLRGFVAVNSSRELRDVARGAERHSGACEKPDFYYRPVIRQGSPNPLRSRGTWPPRSPRRMSPALGLRATKTESIFINRYALSCESCMRELGLVAAELPCQQSRCSIFPLHMEPAGFALSVCFPVSLRASGDPAACWFGRCAEPLITPYRRHAS